MRRLLNPILPLIVAIVVTWTFSAPARAAGAYGVQDDAHFFSPDAVSKAGDLINEIRVGDNRDVLVITYPAIPENLQDSYKSKGKDAFFKDWADQIGTQHRVAGIVILLTKEPAHLEIVVGTQTAHSSFTPADRKELTTKMLEPLKEKENDKALLDGLQFIKERMKRAGSASAAAPNNSNPGNFSPYATPPVGNSPKGFSVGALVCLGVGILIVIAIIIGAVSRGRGYSGGYGGPGGYPPGYSGGSPQGGYPQGGGYGGGGGGFGRGLLGGLLGGALGAWGYERFNQPSNNPNYTPPPGGNYGSSPDQSNANSGDTFGSSSDAGGGDFGSAPDSSSGGGGGGGDFGSSSDSGGGGGDFGGGGGGDFGGGGDSGGSSSGGDF
jgi:hypothetical protein